VSKTHFQQRKYVVKFLGEALHNRRLAIFLGAGVSRDLINDGVAPIGLPTWPALIAKLYAGRRWDAPAGSNYYQQAEDFKNRLLAEGGTFEDFKGDVTQVLYGGINLDFAKIRENPTLAAIGAIVSHSLRGQVAEVFTLNFDDVLERYLRYQGIIAKPVIDEKFWSEPADVRVHHPHGFLPSPDSPFKVSSTFLVFDERSYLEQNSDSRWNQRIEVAMQSHICLFIGLSRDDFHLKQLVSKTSKKHAFSSVRDGFWGVVLRADPKIEEVRDWAQYHVHVESLTDYPTDLPALLFAVCQSAAEFT